MSTTGPGLFQMFLTTGLNHMTVQGIAKAIDWMADIPPDEAKEISRNMSPRHAQQFLRAIEAIQRPPDEG